MGNRRKIKDNRLRLKKNPGVLRRAAAKLNEPTDRPHVPTADEIFGGVPIPAEDDVPQIIKTVPAKHKGVVVGVANIYDDGMVDIKFDDDAPQWALDEIKATTDQMTQKGYSFDGPS